MVSEADHDPRHHTRKMQTRLQETMDHLREDIEKVDEPQLKAMFETVPLGRTSLSAWFMHETSGTVMMARSTCPSFAERI